LPSWSGTEPIAGPFASNADAWAWIDMRFDDRREDTLPGACLTS
jgi:hypothetical protein